MAVVLSEVIMDRRWTVYSLTYGGEVLSHSRHDIQFAVPNFISTDLAARCGTTPIANDPREINARIEVLRKLKVINMEIEASYKGSDRWQRQRAISVYVETRSSDPSKWAKTSVQHVTNLLWQRPAFVNYYAAHKYLMENPLFFVATDHYIKTQTFRIRPLKQVEELEQAQNWIADHRKDEEGQLTRFLKKARIILERYEQTQETRRHYGPLSQEPMEPQYTWNEEDQVFLNCLLRSLTPHRSIQKDPYNIYRSIIMKLLNPQIPTVTEAATFECVKKLGIIAPWQDPFELIPQANPTGDYGRPNPFIEDSEAIAQKMTAPKPTLGTVLGPEDLHPVDPLDSVRHDFGRMRVFVIDEASAEELDDGISVERIPSEPDKFWVHSHIADPTSVLHPGHILCLQARDRGSTLYLGQKSFPLFPKSLVHHPTLGMSLGMRSGTKLGDRTMTFSIKLDSEGNVLAHKVRAGIVRNVRKVTYTNCDRLLGLKPPAKVFPFGRIRPEELEPPATFTEEEAADIKLLYDLAKQQVKRRFDSGLISLNNEISSIDFVTTPGHDIQSPCMKGAIYRGFPEMEYSVSSTGKLDTGSRMLVSEMMKLASRVASRVALEYDIPMLRRAQDPMLPFSDAAQKEMIRSRRWNGYIPMYKFLGHITMIPSSTYTLQPKGHYGLGVPDGEGYSRATSPLRRFEDLVVHWQLHHILLGPNGPPRPRFNVAEMEQLSVDIASVDKQTRRMHKADADFHALMFMKKWLEDSQRGVPRPNGDPLAGTMTGYKVSSTKKNLLDQRHMSAVFLPGLGIKARLVDLTPDFVNVPISAKVKVKMKNIDLGMNQMAFEVTLA